jgi:cytochrome c
MRFATETRLAHAADGDVAKGEQSFRICGACHSIGPDAKNKIGPELNGVVGRKWGSVDGYSYSADLSAGKEQGKAWDEAALNDYLENPKHLAPHGKMSFAGVKSENQRADVIAYLRQFDEKGNKK